MKTQEIVAVIIDIPEGKESDKKKLINFPELDPFFEKGMYIESFSQMHVTEGKCVLTFVFRYQLPSQAKT